MKPVINFFQQQLLFPSPVGEIKWEDVQEQNESLCELIAQERIQNKGVVISNQGGWQSGKSLFEKNHPAINAFKDMIREGAEKFLTEVYGPQEQGFGEIKLEIWANVNTKGHANLPHDHTANANHWSGVYYLKADSNRDVRGFTIFEDRHYTSNGFTLNRIPNFRTENDVKPREAYMVPEAGKMIFFPGTLWHRVEPYRGEVERITIAFNFTASRLALYDFGLLKKGGKFKTFMWYNFRGIMRLLVHIRNIIFNKQ